MRTSTVIARPHGTEVRVPVGEPFTSTGQIDVSLARLRAISKLMDELFHGPEVNRRLFEDYTEDLHDVSDIQIFREAHRRLDHLRLALAEEGTT